MKNILLKLICVLSLILGVKTFSSAQLVHIPDSAFRVYLNQNFGACMVGDSIDSSCPAVLAAKYIDVSSRGISNLSGIEVFVNDTLLNCNQNQLTFIPDLSSSLIELHCTYNQLTSLPNLPMSLTYLECSNNQLTSLPNLPMSLAYLNCFDNQITFLPILPASLTYLNCNKNQLTSLPSLPTSLNNLTCGQNQLTYLPSLPNSLNNLNCGYNQLTSLPVLPTSLTSLGCRVNQLTSLPTLPSSLNILVCSTNQLAFLPTLPTSLISIFCEYNQLNFLPTLPSSLTMLSCYNNQLNSLPILPVSLTQLLCNNNQLTSLPALPTTLSSLSCRFNQITSLPTLPVSLTFLECNNNQLASLPVLPVSLTQLSCNNNQLTFIPTLPASLNYLKCNNNQLASLPELPGTLGYLNCDNNPLTCLPSLNNVTDLYFNNTFVNCLPNYGIVITSSPDIATIPLCDVFNINGCDVFWNIEGTAFLDADTNCNIGITEPFFKNQKLNLYKNGVLDQQTFSNINGDYVFDTFSFDFYKTEFDTMGLPFEVYCPSTGFYLDTISVVDSMKYARDFGLKCKGVDLAVTNIFSNNLRPASIREIKIDAGDYSNYFGAHCAVGISGTVNITITGACNYYSPAIGALTPNTVIGNILTYNVADFGILSYDSSFNFNILVDTTAALGSQICIQVSISTPSTEINYNNNLLSQCFTVVGSFDPNDKTAFPNSTLDISGDRWLTYLIRFQNTGTASAEHIFITDTLSASLDWSTFNLLSYSHQPLTQVYNDGLVKFSFPHINLPDSNTNEPASHGYVQYKIRAKDSLAIGSTIENTANIFFDFNAPVITNTTSNAVINCAIPPTIITASICNGEAYSLNGALYYNDGTYQQKLITSVGCDSIIELQLIVSSITNTISQSSAILQTTASGSGYQWIDCATNIDISGATNSTFQPTQSGDYAVAVVYGTCIDTSSCFAFSMVGLPSSIGADVIFQTRYNSNADHIHLHAEKLKGNKGALRLMDISGRIIFQKQIENIAAGNLDIEIPAKGMNAGIYLLNLITERDNVSGKVVKY
jgi:Leucine-rich repeat (LRR) protein